MKHLLYSFLVFIFLAYNTRASEFVSVHKIGKPLLENVHENNLVAENFELFKTYTISSNNYSISASTNDSIIVKFINESTMRINELSQVIINGFDGPTKSKSLYPEKIKNVEGLLNLSLLQGQLDVICDNTNRIILSTSHAIILPEKSEFIVKTERGLTMIIGLSGKIKVVDFLDRKKSAIVEKNDILVILPRPPLTARGATTKRQNVMTNNHLEDSEYLQYVSSFEKIAATKESVIFINAHDKIYGLEK